MRVTAHTKTLHLILFLIITSLMGCALSEDSDSSSSSSSNSGTVRLSLTTTTGSTTLMADGSSSVPIQITVSDGSGKGMANTTVTFTTTAGTLSVASGTAAARAADEDGSLVNTRSSHTSTVVTDTDGLAQVILTSSTTVETALVTAEVMGFSTTLSVDFISGVPTQISVSATPSMVAAGTTATIEATVTDDSGASIEGITVNFSFTTNNSGGSLSAATGTTDVNGKVLITYSAGAVLGNDVVKAEVSSTISDTVTISVQGVTVNASSLELLVSSPQMDSDGIKETTLTALLRDPNNNFVADANVEFAASSGGILVTNGTTDASGTATALLSTAGDPTTRVITVTATAGTLSDTNTVNVTGNTVTLSGTTSLVLGESTTLSILLRDSSGTGVANKTVTLSSSLGNTLSATTVTTDFNGQAKVTITASIAGSDTIEASAIGTTGSTILTISPANFVFSAPSANAEVNLGAVQTITVHWDEAGVPQANKNINFFATRGVLSAPSATTNASGNASVTISSTNAGPAVITAVATSPGGPSSQLSIEFVATTPASLVLQASRTTLSVNTEDSSDQQSIVTAIVRDANGNLVKNQDVSFTLTDVSGGSIFPASAQTDSFGRASTVYTAGFASSAQDGVSILATVAGVNKTITLTVGQQALFVVLGTGNTIKPLSDTQYAKPYSVLVTDANGNPVEGALVEFNVYPTRYQKGFYVRVYNADGDFVTWAKSLTINAASGFADDADRACDNEDVDRDGLLNSEDLDLDGILDPGEDVNGNGTLDFDGDINNNGVLDPGNIAAVPINLVTDESGFAFFDVVYAREFTWVEVQLEVRARVIGSEGASWATFYLQGLASDFNKEDVAPPGAVSAFGTAVTCACDEQVDPTCLAATGPVEISPVAVVLPTTGGTSPEFTISGGTQSAYTVSTSVGTLTNITTAATGASINVNFGERFTLTIPAGFPTTFFVSATDTVNGQQGWALVVVE